MQARANRGDAWFLRDWEWDILPELNTDFPRTLSLLRREKGVSQKEAAEALGVSQALLSHYERGLREPGLRFVALAADYYNVSADFLLGRSASRDGGDVDPNEFFDASESNDNRVRGSMVAMFSKKILQNALTLVFDLVGKTNDSALVAESYSILSVAIYRMFREVYERSGSEPGKFFALDEREARTLIDARLALAEQGYETSLDRREHLLEPLSHDAIKEGYPQLAQSLFSLIHAVESDAAKLRDLYERE